MSRPRFLGMDVLLASLVLIGLGGGALIAFGATGTEPWNRVADSLGQACIISAVIGLVVERNVKWRFAEEIGRNVFLTLFGHNAPKDYVEALEQYCRRDKVATSCHWTVDMRWADSAREVIAVRTTHISQGVNISSRSIGGPEQVWEIPSVGSRRSSFLGYEFSVAGGDSHYLDREQLQQITSVQTDGSIVCSPEANRNAKIPPGQTYHLRLELLAHRHAHDMLPLVTRVPTFRQTIQLRGDAVEDLDIHLFHENDFLATSGSDQTGGPVYELRSVTFPGQSTILSWHRKQEHPDQHE